MTTSKFIPALRYDWLTGLYDPLIRLTFPERRIKQALIDNLQLTGTEAILDFGCGTGTLAVMIKEQYPIVEMTAIDVDDHILSIAEKKVRAKSMDITFKRFDGQDLSEFGYDRFDRIVSSLVFHHIPTSTKKSLFPQLYKLLKPGGELHIADFGKPQNVYTKLVTSFFRRFDGVENTRVNAEGLLAQFIKAGGFYDVQTMRSFNTPFGSVDLIIAKNKKTVNAQGANFATFMGHRTRNNELF